MKITRITAIFLIFVLVLPLCAAAQEYINRGQVADMLLAAADYYNPTLQRSDIIKGYEDGQLHEDWNVTRAEALVMLKRAFGTIPEPKGHNKRVALTSGDFTDIPQWAEEELKNVFDSGIVAGTSEGNFTPDANITEEQMQLFIDRVYSLFGTNVKDDFYATVNKGTLERLEILPGNAVAGTITNMQINTFSNLYRLILNLTNKEHPEGTKEQKIADFYNCITDVKTRNEQGITPIKTYLDEIDKVKNISELTLVHDMISSEVYLDTFVGFGLTVDLADSSKYMLTFGTMEPLMNKELYEDEVQSKAYIEYLEKILILSGEEESLAKENAKAYFEFEKSLARKMLSLEDAQDIDNVYNVWSYNKISMMFPDFDLEKVLSTSALVKDDKIMVSDIALTEAFAAEYNQANLSVLKTAMKISLIYDVGETLSEDFTRAEKSLNLVLYGTEGSSDIRQIALNKIEEIMPEYVAQIYVERYFNEASIQDVYNMTKEIIETFKKRIDNLTWMDNGTKEKAKMKLDAIRIKVGSPDDYGTYIDDVTILSPAEGGTYYNNMIAIAKEAVKCYGAMQFKEVNHDAWVMQPYDVNAAYDLTSNDITIPAAILMPIIYDKSFSYEEKLGGIGFIIAHEITHAFDSTGARFDENGNVKDWWKESDYKEFELLCEKVVDSYDGIESIPAVRNNGRLTLNENIADLGAMECITDIATEKNLDLKKVYSATAKAWATTSTREYVSFMSEIDTHSGEKIRINHVLKNIDEFYEVFEIVENDGMYIPPEERVKVW